VMVRPCPYIDPAKRVSLGSPAARSAIIGNGPIPIC